MEGRGGGRKEEGGHKKEQKKREGKNKPGVGALLSKWLTSIWVRACRPGQKRTSIYIGFEMRGTVIQGKERGMSALCLQLFHVHHAEKPLTHTVCLISLNFSNGGAASSVIKVVLSYFINLF